MSDLSSKILTYALKKGFTMTKKFTSLEELKNFVIAEKIANFEKQKEIENKLFASLQKKGA